MSATVVRSVCDVYDATNCNGTSKAFCANRIQMDRGSSLRQQWLLAITSHQDVINLTDRFRLLRLVSRVLEARCTVFHQCEETNP